MILHRLLELWETALNQIRLLLKTERNTDRCQKKKIKLGFLIPFQMQVLLKQFIQTVDGTEPKKENHK